MTDKHLMERAGAAAGYEIQNCGDGTLCNITLDKEGWNPLEDQSDAERLDTDMKMGAKDLDTVAGRRALVEAAVDCCVKED
ncbi:hypothetical protein SAMN05216421_1128 [Halopseudomonas xinjiangensis]|uniref:Uncharacterized protein n=1 Tax=Halopseudomonas xinjiangensis TaxID=487184 RepID=A0A1H1QHE3_9GAMM|nr:hypothetical protein [Halopseudomonas xinjiangensis]SDS22319.1 hypothetical protein SAMN05216421_1128 [Halopseudomonas xinjiangensis]